MPLGQWRREMAISRIWEYDRSYSGGPDFYITRFGSNFYHEGLADGTFDREAGVSGQDWKRKIENAKKEIAAARHAFYEKYNGWITAGPIVTEDFRSQAFVAVARGRKGDDRNDVIDGFIYELDPENGIETMTTVPREVIGWPYKVYANTAIWACRTIALSAWRRGGRMPVGTMTA